MEAAARSGSVIRFKAFELDLHTRELHKHGLKLKLQGHPIDVLAMLVERPGELVTRDELQKKLWPEDTFVDFEHGLNSAINRLREALGDNAESPRYIETLPRRGYRFIASVETDQPLSVPLQENGATGDSSHGSEAEQREVVVGAVREPPLRKGWTVATTGVALLAVVIALFALNIGGLRDRTLRAVRAMGEPQSQSIAVLPLANLSRDPEQEYFADGMTDALITDLGRIGALRVISRQSVMGSRARRNPCRR